MILMILVTIDASVAGLFLGHEALTSGMFGASASEFGVLRAWVRGCTWRRR